MDLASLKYSMAISDKFRSGWSRLWLVISIIWIFALIYPGYIYVWKLLWPHSYVITNPAGSELTVVFSSEIPEADVHNTIRQDFFPKFKEYPEEYSGRTVRAPYEVYIRSNAPNRIIAALIILIVPPIALFALGHGVAWIRRGFQVNKNGA
jgi:hypothetical protein